MGCVRAVSGRLNVAALVIGVILLAVGPVALTLARAADYRSSATVSLNEENPSTGHLSNPGQFITGPLQVEDLQRDVAKEVGWFDAPEDLEDYVTVAERDESGRRAYVVTARGPTPAEAGELAEITRAHLIEAAEASARFTQELQLQRIRRALRREDLSTAEREELLSRRGEIAASLRRREGIFTPDPNPATLARERIGDRILGVLPGSRPLRPNPVWAAVAGVALALAMALWVLVLSSPSRSGGAPSRS
jgi:hypothetical protein